MASSTEATPKKMTKGINLKAIEIPSPTPTPTPGSARGDPSKKGKKAESPIDISSPSTPHTFNIAGHLAKGSITPITPVVFATPTSVNTSTPITMPSTPADRTQASVKVDPFEYLNAGRSKHTGFSKVYVHTAKCDCCMSNCKTVLQRCNRCNVQFCPKSGCFEEIMNDGIHSANYDDLSWVVDPAGARTTRAPIKPRNNTPRPKKLSTRVTKSKSRARSVLQTSDDESIVTTSATPEPPTRRATRAHAVSTLPSMADEEWKPPAEDLGFSCIVPGASTRRNAISEEVEGMSDFKDTNQAQRQSQASSKKSVPEPNPTGVEFNGKRKNSNVDDGYRAKSRAVEQGSPCYSQSVARFERNRRRQPSGFQAVSQPRAYQPPTLHSSPYMNSLPSYGSLYGTSQQPPSRQFTQAAFLPPYQPALGQNATSHVRNRVTPNPSSNASTAPTTMLGLNFNDAMNQVIADREEKKKRAEKERLEAAFDHEAENFWNTNEQIQDIISKGDTEGAKEIFEAAKTLMRASRGL